MEAPTVAPSVTDSRSTVSDRRTIGVGIDASVESSVALAWALERSRRTGAALRLVTVIEKDEEGALGSGFAQRAASEAFARISDVARTVHHESPDVALALEVVRGPVGWALARSVSVEDLLVVGTTVSRPADDHVLGSRSVQIASISRGTVAVVPPLLGDHRSGVVVGIETVADLPALLVLGLRESRLGGEPLVLIHCSSRGGRNSASVLSAIDEALTAVDDDVRVIHLRCDPAEGLVGTAAHASLLVLGRSRTPDLNPLGTTCHRVLSRARSPVLIAPVHIGPTHVDPTTAGARSDHPEEARP